MDLDYWKEKNNSSAGALFCLRRQSFFLSPFFFFFRPSFSLSLLFFFFRPSFSFLALLFSLLPFFSFFFLFSFFFRPSDPQEPYVFSLVRLSVGGGEGGRGKGGEGGGGGLPTANRWLLLEVKNRFRTTRARMQRGTISEIWKIIQLFTIFSIVLKFWRLKKLNNLKNAQK